MSELGFVEILGQATSKSEKQIPSRRIIRDANNAHPAQTVGIRDDNVVRNGVWTAEVNRGSELHE